MKSKLGEMKMGDVNSEWADVMKNILSMDKPKSKNSMILSRAEKLDPKLEKDSDDDETKPSPSELIAKANLKKEWISRGRYKPNPSLESEREKKLRRIAVAGVVQLFNAVGKQQRNTGSSDITDITTAAPPAKKFKSLDKKSFFNILLGKDQVKSEDVEKEERTVPHERSELKEMKEENNQDSQWDVLRSNFMMSTKLKDWDKEIDS